MAKILIVEDVCMARALLQRFMEPYGECISVENGRQAIIEFNSAWVKETPFDLICLDIMMPEMNGQEVLENIREIEDSMDVPEDKFARILMTSALNDADHVIDAIKAKCDGYISKPYSKEKIKNALQNLAMIEA